MIEPQGAGLWTLGIKRNDYFTGRAALLEALHDELSRRGRAALSGLGGVGKTQIATEYAYRYRDEYEDVFWVHAADTSHLECTLMYFADQIGVPPPVMQDQTRALEAVRQYLETSEGWLLVYDSADDPGYLKDFMPRTQAGHVIITTRAQVLDTFGIAKPINVEEMTPDEALKFMLRRTGREDTEPDEHLSAQALVEELGYLPIALEQAAAFIAGKQSRFRSYLDAYRHRRLSLLDRASPVIGDSTKCVTTTWSIAFDSLAATPVAADILAASAFLSPDQIPLDLLLHGAPHLGAHVAAALPDAGDELRLDEVLEPLARYSLIRRDIPCRTFTVHRLVQEVARNRMTPEERKSWAERAVRALNAIFPTEEFEDWSLCELLVPHVRAVARNVLDAIAPCAEAADLLNNAGRYFFRRGPYADAEVMFAKSLSLRESLFGGHHAAVAASLNNLGNVYFNQGKYVESEALHERALQIREELLGTIDGDVADSLNNVAVLHHIRGRFCEAETLHKRAIEVREAIFGPDHSEVALSLDNLGCLFFDEEKYDEAEPLHRRALEIRRKTLRPEHPFVAASMDNLASVHRGKGRYDEAETLHRAAADIRERSLGREHNKFAESLVNLANVYRFQRKFSDAESLCTRALAIYEKSLGANHQDTARCLNELACLCRAQGKTEEAQTLHDRALSIAAAALGEDYPLLTQMRADFARAESRTAAEKGVLTRREREVAVHVAEGRSNRTIAQKLSLSERTVESHVASILSKLSMTSRGEIAAYVLRDTKSVLAE